MYTIGTAGHVDHGKSALVKALTGIDPDRLREEKERGMTIDLGFAWLRLPSGREISIVDVPGHERFVKNMLAGVGGIDLALLVVAADEGVMPQTREHLAILDLLRIKRGLVAITKVDLVDEEWLSLVTADVEDVLKGTVLAEAPIVTVSAKTREGLSQLLATLDDLLADTPPKRDIGRPRLAVDRVFTITGFGTVVTGTLIDGRFQVGQGVEIQPAGRQARIRGLQTHKQRVEVAMPGNRVAINLAVLSTSDLQRGDIVTIPGWLQPTQAIDVGLRLLPDARRPLPHNTLVAMHTGSAEVMAKVLLLDREELKPGETSWAQLRLAAPVAVVRGDLFVLRTPNETIGGGEIVEPHAKRHKRFQSEVLRSLSLLTRGSVQDLVQQSLEGRFPLELDQVVQRSGLPREQCLAILQELVQSGQVIPLDSYFLTENSWRVLAERVEAILGSYHQQHPLRLGMPKEEVRSRLALPSRAFNETVARLAREGRLVETDSKLRLVEHLPQFTTEQQEKVKQLLVLLAEHPHAPPSRQELEQQLSLEAEVIDSLIEQGKLVKVSDSLVFLPSALEKMKAEIVNYISNRGSVTVAEVRDMFKTSRKYALAIMEFLDEQKVTRRVGDERLLR
ncbi:MAG: selenocysteine-specific translation elongation factor [Chloroflexi bacterium]|nr:selenocysteine-specific translation elongation factor [Chloroflexota bacterium]MCL5074446.1 selenocysteine-specific translation elongation factor [Chloroflexota bacterium]